MSEIVQKWVGLVSKIGIAVVIFSTLFLFTNLTTDFYDAPKFLILLAVTSILLILITLKFSLTNKVVLIRTSLDLPLLLLAAVAVISTVTSSSRFVSLLGSGAQVHGSLAALVTYILFYFVAVNTLKTAKDIRQTVSLLILGGIILSVISVLAYFGVKLLPPPWSHGVNFTPAGNNFSVTALLALLVPIVTMEILGKPKFSAKVIYAFILVLFGIVIALTGTISTIVAFLTGLILVSLIFKTQFARLPDFNGNPGTVLLISSLVIIALVTAISFLPGMGNKNPLYNLSKNFPREIQIPFDTSWKISVSSFRDSPFWGSGPSTYLFDFTTYKPIEFNNSRFWNIRFDSAFNEYFGVLATLGGVGLAALIFATLFFLSPAVKTIQSALKDISSTSQVSAALAVSGIVFFVLLALHASTLPLFVIGLLILAAFMGTNHLVGANPEDAWKKTGGFKQVLMRIASEINLTDSSKETLDIEALPTILLTVSIALVGFVLFFAGKFTLADFHHRQALNAISQNQGLLAYNELVAAEKLNPNNDLYRTDLAQTNFALANAIAVAKGPSAASPSGSLTDQDRQNIQVLLSQAITEGRTATTLSPRSTVNWEILGLLYRQISGVAQNALLFSLDSYGRSIQNDPLNPLLRLSVGGVYYAIQNYDMAIRFFTDSVNLKPDFANGFYNLSVAFRDKGDLQSALFAAQKVIELVDKNSQDFKTAQDFLKDIESKAQKATESANLKQAQTAQDTGALQNKELPKVVELPKPENIATPAAVKKSSATPEPSATPSPTPIP